MKAFVLYFSFILFIFTTQAWGKPASEKHKEEKQYLNCSLNVPEKFRAAKVNPAEKETILTGYSKPVAFCNDKVFWDETLNPRRGFTKFKKTIRESIGRRNNLGGGIFKFPGGTKTVYRSVFLGATSVGQVCLKELVKKHKVKTIVNLYSGSLSNPQDAVEEQKILKTHGGSKTRYIYKKGFNYRPVNMALSHFKKHPQKCDTECQTYIKTIKKKFRKNPRNPGLTRLEKQFMAWLNHLGMKLMTKVITEVIYGINKAPGNVLIHCMGGMHRTGMLFGVLRKCINKLGSGVSLIHPQVHNEYACHTSRGNPLNKTKPRSKNKGGYKSINVKFIEQYPCNVLERELRPADPYWEQLINSSGTFRDITRSQIEAMELSGGMLEVLQDPGPNTRRLFQTPQFIDF